MEGEARCRSFLHDSNELLPLFLHESLAAPEAKRLPVRKDTAGRGSHASQRLRDTARSPTAASPFGSIAGVGRFRIQGLMRVRLFSFSVLRQGSQDGRCRYCQVCSAIWLFFEFARSRPTILSSPCGLVWKWSSAPHMVQHVRARKNLKT